MFMNRVIDIIELAYLSNTKDRSVGVDYKGGSRLLEVDFFEGAPYLYKRFKEFSPIVLSSPDSTARLDELRDLIKPLAHGSQSTQISAELSGVADGVSLADCAIRLSPWPSSLIVSIRMDEPSPDGFYYKRLIASRLHR